MFDLLTPANLVALAIIMGMMLTVYAVVLPMVGGNKLNTRMKSVALEREKIRARERARLVADKKERTKAVKKEPGEALRALVDKLNLRSALADEKTSQALVHAGYRGQAPLFRFLAARALLPIVFGVAGGIYFYILADNDWGSLKKMIATIMSAAAGFYLPVLFVNQRKKARQLSLVQAWPDALDLCLICVESGMSIEAAFRRVAAEIGSQSVALAEELMLTTAELSYLQDRRTAYDNLTERTGLEAVKNVVLSLVQAERYGTPLAAALRVLSQENRDQRMAKAEAKAASLPPKLTVPMMVCFLPVLFCVILAPAIIKAVYPEMMPG